MPAKRYRVKLTEEEQTELNSMVSKGKGLARRITRARILLLADENRADGDLKDAEIVQALSVSQRTVERTREKCTEFGIETALNHKRSQKKREKILDGEAEARLVQLACSEAPDGHDSWSLQMLGYSR